MDSMRVGRRDVEALRECPFCGLEVDERERRSRVGEPGTTVLVEPPEISVRD
jgi:hypothetical protein